MPGVCNVTTGSCDYDTVSDGSTCDDGSLCTYSDQCVAGLCFGTPVTCDAPNSCYESGYCDENSGSCVNAVKPNGTLCSDNNACTTKDYCHEGSCISGIFLYSHSFLTFFFKVLQLFVKLQTNVMMLEFVIQTLVSAPIQTSLTALPALTLISALSTMPVTLVSAVATPPSLVPQWTNATTLVSAIQPLVSAPIQMHLMENLVLITMLVLLQTNVMLVLVLEAMLLCAQLSMIVTMLEFVILYLECVAILPSQMELYVAMEICVLKWTNVIVETVSVMNKFDFC